jgi:5-methylcytosine-specific restriction endonuclease McrBC GTP-binding regulatory subunit McrB
MEKFIQKILFGSPGTGKSYRIDNQIVPKELGIDKDTTPENIIKTVFHPEYTYGDFMGKLVPNTGSRGVEYKYYGGHFLRALSQAYKNIYSAHDKQGNQKTELKNVVLVIDEINRGNSSAIFGTVFQLLDRDENGWSNYAININEIEFLKLLEFIGTKVVYDAHGNINEYKLSPHDGVKELEILQKKIDFLRINLTNKTIMIPPNLSIIATMNTSDSSIYYMDSAFKRRWDWEFIDVDSKSVKTEGIAFGKREEWQIFIEKLNKFIKYNHKSIRGVEDKQVGLYFIKDQVIEKVKIQNKLMFFIWDNVFSRDKKPLVDLLFDKDKNGLNKLITFGDFAKEVDLFIKKINGFNSDV